MASFEALDQVLCDFLTQITSRPDKKLKGLSTVVEQELEQAKLQITALRDTQMRQETALRQYAEEAKYYKDSLSRRDAEMGVKRSQLLTEILKLKSEITRLQMAQDNESGAAQAVVSQNTPAHAPKESGDGDAATVPAASAGARNDALKKLVMTQEEKKTTMRLNAEITQLRKEAKELMDNLTDMSAQNNELVEQIERIVEEKDEEIQKLNEELEASEAKRQELQAKLDSRVRPAAKLYCIDCCAPIGESPVCSDCQTAQIREQLTESLTAKITAELQASLPEPKTDVVEVIKEVALDAKPDATAARLKAGATLARALQPKAPAARADSCPKCSGKACPTCGLPPDAAKPDAHGAKTRSRFLASAGSKVLTGVRLGFKRGAVTGTQEAGQAEPSAGIVPMVAPKKVWSYEKDIEAFQEHCDRLVAEERELWQQRLAEKDSDLQELHHAALQGRTEIYGELKEIERNYWEPQIVECRKKLFEVSSAYEILCEAVAEDLEDIAMFVAVRKVPYTHEKNDIKEKEREYTNFINKQMQTIKDMRKQSREAKKKLRDQQLEIEQQKLEVANEIRKHEREVLEMRQTLLQSDTKMKRLEYMLAQLQGKELVGRNHLQSQRIKAIQDVDLMHAWERRNVLSKKGSHILEDVQPTLALSNEVNRQVKLLRRVFFANTLESEDEEEEDAGEAGSPRQISPRGSGGLDAIRMKTDQLDPLKQKREITKLKKQIRELKREIGRSRHNEAPAEVSDGDEEPTADSKIAAAGSVPSRRSSQAGFEGTQSIPRVGSGERPSRAGSSISRAGSREMMSRIGSTDVSPRSKKVHHGDSGSEVAGDIEGGDGDPIIRASSFEHDGAASEVSTIDENGKFCVATQTPIGWRQESPKRVSHSYDGAEYSARDSQLASMLPSMNLSVSMMRPGKGAIYGPCQTRTASSPDTLQTIAERNSRNLRGSANSRPQSARQTGRMEYLGREPCLPGNESRPSSAGRREVWENQGQGFSHALRSAEVKGGGFSIEFVKVPRPPAEPLVVSGTQTTKTPRTPRTSFSAKRVDTEAGQIKPKKIRVQLGHGPGAADETASVVGFPVRTGSGYLKEEAVTAISSS